MDLSEKLIYENLDVDENGNLLMSGQSVCSLASVYGTPLYLMDADRIHSKCRTFMNAMHDAFGCNSKVMYASKAASFKEMYRIMKAEGMYVDVVSSGEIQTALSAGFPPQRMVFHSCGKTDSDIEFATDSAIGCIAVDSFDELKAVDRIAGLKGIVQNIILRLTPGIDSHTFDAVATGVADSKFGFSIASGSASDALSLAIDMKNVKLSGFHCHVGSQIFDKSVYLRTAEIMLSFISNVKRDYGFVTENLDIGGGFGVRYTSDQTSADVCTILSELGSFMNERCEELCIKMPAVGIEPGRSIVADAGMTLYSAMSVKEIPGLKTYVLVDGGMTDNVRYAMYKAPYTVVYPADMKRQCDMMCTVAGRCCESGDVVQPDVFLPSSVTRGDFIAVLGTGAYNYSMASNYNRIPRPPVIMIEQGKSFVAVRRETVDDVCGLDL